MPRVSSTKVANKDGSCKSLKKLPGGSKPVRHRRSVAGCLACRIRGKPCDQQLSADAYGLPTCKNCSKLNIACIGGFGERKVPNDQWKFWFRLRIKLYNIEAGKARGIRGRGRSGPNLRKTPLLLEEIQNFVNTHVHLSREEGENHEHCIFLANGACQVPSSHPVDESDGRFLLSPSITETSSDFSQPPSTPMDFPDSPIIPLGQLGETPLFDLKMPDASTASSLLLYHDPSFSSFNAPTQHLPDDYNFFVAPAVGLMESYGTGSQDIQAFSPQSNVEDDTFASQPTTSDANVPFDWTGLEEVFAILQSEHAALAGFTQGVFDGEQA